jgi:M6 family metalloprotease-like protein
MKRLFVYSRIVLFFLFLNAPLGQAEPAYPHPVQYKLPDGAFITITLKGDEHVSWAVSPDGYTLLTNREGYYEYARKNVDGNLVLSGTRAHNPDKRNVQEVAFLKKTAKDIRYSAEQIVALRSILNTQTHLRNATQTTASVPTTGTVRAPLILVGFQDKPFTLNREAFNLLMNQPDYTANGTITGSVHDYYYDNSYGELDYQVDIYGPYTLSHDIIYYDYKSEGGDSKRMAAEAIQMADADGCNFAQYDSDNDGYLDGLHIIFAGYSQASGAPQGQSIWSHVGTVNATCDGKKIQRYSCSPELRGKSGTNITHIGVIAHELGHVFGLPDLYDTDYAESGGESVHIGHWDIMAFGSQNDEGRTPANFSAYCKDILGWKPATVLNASAQLLLPNPALKDITYRINTTKNNEYFLVENRQRTGWDSHIPASGMLIYHVDKTYSGWNTGKVNASPAHRGLYIKQAGGGLESNSATRTTDPYPSGGNTSFTDTSTPNSKSWAGQNTAKPITGIVHNTTNRTVSFAFMGGSDDDKLIELQALPLNAGTIQGEENYYRAGTTLTFTAIPASGYRFSRWINGNTISTDNPYSFQVTDDVTLIAEFLPFSILENLFTEDFEANTDTWTLINGVQTNQWLIGSTIAHSGSKSAYISNNGNVHNYTLNQASTVHLYRDVAFPALPNGHFRLDFDWKGKGEYPNGEEVDYMEVRLIDSGVTPEAGGALSAGTLLGKFFGADWQHAEIILPDDLANTSKRLVFTWINNESGGSQPPVAIDNVVLNRVQPLEFAQISFLKKHNDTQPSTVSFVGIDDVWSASASDWITLNPAEGSINNSAGQFTFSCTENNENSAREGFITLNVNEKTFELKVMQAGIAPSGLEAVYDNTAQSVKLNWNPLVSESVESSEMTLKWHNGVSGNPVGFVPRDHIEAAICFTPEDLASCRGTKIRALEIYAGMLGGDMAVNIRQDGQLIYTQSVTGLPLNKFTRINLEKSVPIDITKELLAGFSYKQRFGTSNNTVFSRDTGPVVAGKNFQSFDQGLTFTPYTTSNWNIALFVSRDATPAYHVYRNGERIAEMLNEAVFEDFHPPLNTDICYTVSAAYNGNATLESIASDAACLHIEGTGVENLSRNNRPLFEVYTKGNYPEVCNYAEYPAIVSLYGISGQMLYSVTLEAGETKSPDVELARGVYFVKASYKNGENIIKKIFH